MAIAWGTLAPATPPQVTTSNNGTTHSYNVTCTADTDVVLIWAASYNSAAVSGNPADRASATWDESPIAEIDWYTQGGSFGDDQPMQAWLVPSPGAGSHALAITLPNAGGSATREFLSMAIPLEGVDLDQLPTAFQTAGATTGTSPSITVNDLTAGDLVVAMGTTWDMGQSAHTGTVLAQYDEEADNSAWAAWNVQAAFAESTSLSIGWTAASSDDWMIVALRFVASTGGGGDEQELVVPHVSSTAALFAPIVLAGAVALAAPHIASTAVLHAPVVLPGPVTVEPPAIASTAVLPAPVVLPGPVTIEPPTIASTATLYPPAIVSGDVLAPPHIDSTMVLHEPTVAPGPVTVELPTIASTAELYPPAVAHGVLELGYVTLTGEADDYLVTPDAPSLEFSGADLCVVALVRPHVAPANYMAVVQKYATGGPSWYLAISSTGQLRLSVYSGGGGERAANSAAGAVTFAGTWQWVAATLVGDNGSDQRVYRFYTSPDGETWVQLGTAVAASGAITSIDDTDTPLGLGRFMTSNVAGYDGDIGVVSVRDGTAAGGTVGGVEIFRFDGTADIHDPVAASFPSSSGHLLTVVGDEVELVPAEFVPTVSPPAIASTAVLYPPVVVPGRVDLAPPAIASTVVLHAPVVVPGVATLSPPAIASTVVLYPPVVVGGELRLPPPERVTVVEAQTRVTVVAAQNRITVV